MIHSNDRTGFRQPITLNDRKAEMLPELLKVRIDFRAPYDKRPELPPEMRMNLTVSPQPSQHTARLLVGSSFLGKSFDLVSHVLENSRDTHDHGNPVFAHESDDLCRVRFAGEHGRTMQEK